MIPIKLKGVVYYMFVHEQVHLTLRCYFGHISVYVLDILHFSDGSIVRLYGSIAD